MGWVKGYRWKSSTSTSLRSPWGNLSAKKKKFLLLIISSLISSPRPKVKWWVTWPTVIRIYHHDLVLFLIGAEAGNSSNLLSKPSPLGFCLCWHPCQVRISFHLKNDYAPNCSSTKEASYCTSAHSRPTNQPCWDLTAVRGDKVIWHRAGDCRQHCGHLWAAVWCGCICSVCFLSRCGPFFASLLVGAVAESAAYCGAGDGSDGLYRVGDGGSWTDSFGHKVLVPLCPCLGQCCLAVLQKQ